MSKGDAERQARRRQKMQDAGYTLVRVYVPAKDADKVREYARQLSQQKTPMPYGNN